MLVNLLVISGIDFYQGGLLTRGLYDLAAGFLGAVGVTMIVSVTLPFFEAVFDIATDIKLLELLDPNDNWDPSTLRAQWEAREF